MSVNDKDVDKLLEFLRGKEKLNATDIKSPEYKSDLDKDVVRVKGPAPVPEKVTRIAGGTQHFDTKGITKLESGDDFKAKIAKLTGLKNAGKKALGILPMAGAAYGLMSGDPAMAAEEAAGDLVPGLEAIKSEAAGMSPEDESIMLAEDKARKNYNKSPAKLDKLRAMMGGRMPAAQEPRLAPTELSVDQPPASSARDFDPQSPEMIAPDMQDQIRNKLQQAEELTPEEVKASKLRKLFNLRS